MKDLLVGAVDTYNWNQIKPWAESIRETGFDGDVFLIVYRLQEDITKQATDLGIELYNVEHTPYMTPIVHEGPNTPTQSHNFRFYHIWELLTRLSASMRDYNSVILTDVRDVYFQSNPSKWLQDSVHEVEFIIAPSEGIRFGKEEWNQNNIISGFGRLIYDLHDMDNKPVANVGTIAGSYELMKDLCLTIFTMTEGRYYPSDQSSFNILINGLLSPQTLFTHMDQGWAAQMGTTNDPTKSWLWEHLIEARPEVNVDDLVYTPSGNRFCMVHQWDRVPQLKQMVQRKYNV
jgi:hypothetical protein